MKVDVKDIEVYLVEVKRAISEKRYRLDTNRKRQDNRNLFFDYVLDEKKVTEILLELSVQDFSDVVQNEHIGYEDEQLYIFGKDVSLLERAGTERKEVPLYIKFNKLDNDYVIIISFHEQKYPLKYYFE